MREGGREGGRGMREGDEGGREGGREEVTFTCTPSGITYSRDLNVAGT